MGFGYGKTTYHNSTARNADGKIVKQVFNNRMVAHVWAQDVQTFGRSHNGNFYFEGRKLYSYGAHYVVGYLIEPGRAFINTDKASISTGGHQSDARRALREYIGVPDLTEIVWALEHKCIRTIKRHIEKHPDTNIEAVETLLSAVGGNPKQAGRLLTKALIKRNKERAKQQARNRLHAAKEGKRYADMTAAEWRDYVDGLNIRFIKGTAYGSLPHAAARLLVCQKMARAVGWTRVAKTLGQRRKELRGMIRHASAVDERQRVNAWARQCIQTVRRGLNVLRHGAGLGGTYEYTQFAAACAVLRARHPQLTGLAALQDAAEQEAERLRVIERAERFRRETAKREAWLAGDRTFYAHFSDERGGAMLRAIDIERDADGQIVAGTLQTSHGASCPLTHALKAFAFVRMVVAKCRDDSTCEGWQSNGRKVRVGHFQVDSIAADGTMKAGCHVIHFTEMERLAAVLGVDDIAPSDAAVSA